MSYLNSNNYLNYLIQNCGVQGYDFEATSERLPDVSIIMQYAQWLELQPTDEILEVGCGLGRILKELHETFQVSPHGIDVLSEVIEEAKKRVGTFCKSLQTASAESIHFPDQTFDKIICWGVFDLTDQTRALKEITRILKKEGLILITGKTSHYEKNDIEALEAEKACIHKKIPNHYTDISALQQWAKSLGLTIADYRFFRRRGDFIRNQPCDPSAEQFYEYIFLFKRKYLIDIHSLEGPLVGKKKSDTLTRVLNEQQQ